MKNTALIFNAVLLILVGVLFYWHFSSKKETTPRVESMQNNSSASNTGFRIGYFEWDSVTNNFELFKALRDTINQKEENNERRKMSLRQQYQNRYKSYAQKQMSQTESEIASQDMKNMEASISTEMQRMDQDLSDYTVRKQKDIKSNIEDFLKEYTKTNKYAFIFANEPGLIFYRDTVYNITSDLIKGLNEKFPKKK
jgi:outer membrane protein